MTYDDAQTTISNAPGSVRADVRDHGADVLRYALDYDATLGAAVDDNDTLSERYSGDNITPFLNVLAAWVRCELGE